MKKFFLSVLSIHVTIAVSAQPTLHAGRFTGGPKAGINFSNFTSDSLGNNKYKLGFHLGSFVNYTLNDNFSIQGELLFSSKGAKFKSHSAIGAFGIAVVSDVDATYNLNYIDIPILFRANLVSGAYFNAGVQPSFLINAKYSGQSTASIFILSSSSSFSETNKEKLGLNSADFGVLIGTGYQSKSGLNVSLRANIGLGDIDKNNSKTSNLVFQASIGYSFGMEKKK